MKENRTTEKVVAFAQSQSSVKAFRHDYPVSDELKEDLLLKVYKDFTHYIINHYYTLYREELSVFIDDHHPRKEKWQSLESNLFWWKLMHDSNEAEVTFTDDYIEDNRHTLNKKPLVASWLKEWDKAVPKFYYIGYKYNDRVLVVVDMLTNETLDVIVYAPTAATPKKGEIVMGTLIPIGDALYFPIIDFYHFDAEASKQLAPLIIHNYDKHSEASRYEAFIHVLSVALQIERIIFLENHQNTTFTTFTTS
ncbi:hypothetical protein GCM10007063_30460 [Lentibacillus kapialis]|uniref:Uncharacterized protein n=1 Tax=Lentibacillus kapialis TaxID=340214 RepID=A0A917V0R4_9BACI|nr:hypothetical protein [Lentibacillus kapialis]GGK05954.1 hypothetical protein GCM10007063_30460 [Lentibacillus kapialis]